MNGKLFVKTANEAGVWGFNWTQFLNDENDQNGETITESIWSSTPSGLSLTLNTIDLSDKRAVVKIGAGVDRVTYRVVNKITTSGGGVWERYFDLIIDDYDTLS